MLLLSDGIGAFAGLLLAIPPLRDQGGRFKERRQARGNTAVPSTRGILRRSLRARRDAFNGYDTLLLALGSIGLLLSFGLKLFDR